MKAFPVVITAFLLGSPPVAVFTQTPENGLILHFSGQAPGQDLSGMQNDGKWNDISTGPGIPGISAHSISFDGSDSYIQVPPSTFLDTCKSMTVATWFNARAFSSATSRLYLVERLFGAKNAFMQLAVFFDAALFAQTDGQDTQWLTFPEFLKKNSWYHIAGVFDYNRHEMRLYFNGILRKKTVSDLVPAVSATTPMYIGAHNFNGQVSHLYEGCLEDLRLYNRALSDTEVRALTKNFVFSKPALAFEQVSRLEAGRYLLTRVDSAGAYQGARELVEVSAEEPLWKHGWFVALSLAGTFLLTSLLAFFYSRIRQQEQVFLFEKARLLERERYRIAREMHDDIGTGLSAINLLTEIALNKNQDPRLAAEIARIAATARDVNTRIQDIIWAISTQHDTLAGLAQHLQRMATEMLAPAGIVLLWNVPAKLPVLEISGARRRVLYLVAKEALHNIVKHARATQVEMALELSGQQLGIRIRDNGRGFNPAAVGDRGNGLVNMRHRLEEAGGQFDLRSDSAGTSVVCILPCGT